MEKRWRQQGFSLQEKKEINGIFHLSIPDVKLGRNYPRRCNNTSYHLGLVTAVMLNHSLAQTSHNAESNPCIHCRKNEILFAWFYIMPLLFHV